MPCCGRRRTGTQSAAAELVDAFTGRLEFGTAGLRGALGPGPNRMNRVVVGQAAAGLAAYLLDHGLAGGRVLVGFDARHNSDVFAADTAEIMAGAGFSVLITARPLPTPVIAFGIGHLSCVAAVVVTASHNPPQDNGYKVYLGDGSQIVPPADAEIAARIEQVAAQPLSAVARSAAYAVLGEELVDAYLARAASLVPGDAPRAVRWVYTPLHGVGGSLVERAAAAAGFPPATVVAEQAEPDPDFPTVAFPNPEEPGAIDLALARAADIDADLVIANDPDADRCAVATVVDGQWRMLRGDELGRAAGGRRAAPRPDRDVRLLDRLQFAAVGDGRGVRSALRLHPDRLQVDRPRTRPRLRLRGGDRLLRRPRGGPGQGRDHRADPGLDPGRRAQGDRPDPGGPARRDRRALRRLRDRPAVRTGRRPRPDRGGHDPAPGPPAGRPGRPTGRRSSTWPPAVPTCRPPTAS